MPFPLPVPPLTQDESTHFRQKLEDFEPPEEMKEDLAKHRNALK